jgi:hypothetical protein
MSDKGAHFFRCDLQVHTPRDINWTGKNAITDDERRAYAKSLVRACRDKGLQGIAITDHHDMLCVSYVRKAAAEETDTEGKPLQRRRCGGCNEIIDADLLHPNDRQTRCDGCIIRAQPILVLLCLRDCHEPVDALRIFSASLAIIDHRTMTTGSEMQSD